MLSDSWGLGASAAGLGHLENVIFSLCVQRGKVGSTLSHQLNSPWQGPWCHLSSVLVPFWSHLPSLQPEGCIGCLNCTGASQGPECDLHIWHQDRITGWTCDLVAPKVFVALILTYPCGAGPIHCQGSDGGIQPGLQINTRSWGDCIIQIGRDLCISSVLTGELNLYGMYIHHIRTAKMLEAFPPSTFPAFSTCALKVFGAALGFTYLTSLSGLLFMTFCPVDFCNI